MVAKSTLNVSVSVTVTVPLTVVVVNVVPVLVVLVEVSVPTVVTPVCVVVCPTEETDRLVDVAVDRIDVKVVVLVPAVGPVTVLVVDVVPVTSGLFVIADNVVDSVLVAKVVVVEVDEVVNVEDEVKEDVLVDAVVTFERKRAKRILYGNVLPVS
jgi:hypothetical protein